MNNTFACGGQSANTVNKVLGVSLAGDCGTFNAATCREAQAISDTIDSSSQATNTMNKGIGMSFSGDCGTCHAATDVRFRQGHCDAATCVIP